MFKKKKVVGLLLGMLTFVSCTCVAFGNDAAAGQNVQKQGERYKFSGFSIGVDYDYNNSGSCGEIWFLSNALLAEAFAEDIKTKTGIVFDPWANTGKDGKGNCLYHWPFHSPQDIKKPHDSWLARIKGMENSDLLCYDFIDFDFAGDEATFNKIVEYLKGNVDQVKKAVIKSDFAQNIKNIAVRNSSNVAKLQNILDRAIALIDLQLSKNAEETNNLGSDAFKKEYTKWCEDAARSIAACHPDKAEGEKQAQQALADKENFGSQRYKDYLERTKKGLANSNKCLETVKAEYLKFKGELTAKVGEVADCITRTQLKTINKSYVDLDNPRNSSGFGLFDEPPVQ